MDPAEGPAGAARRRAEDAMRLARVRRLDAAREALLDAERCGPFDTLSTEGILIALARAQLAYFRGNERDGIALTRQALEHAQLARLQPLEARLHATLSTMLLDPMTAQVEEAVRSAMAADALRHLADPETRLRTELAFGLAHSYAGDWAAAVDRYARADAEAREDRDPLMRAGLAHAMALAALSDARQRCAAGTFDDATRTSALVALERAFERLAPLVDAQSLRVQRIFVAELLARGGDFAEARVELAPLLPLVTAQGPADLAAVGLAVEARCLLAEGEAEAAHGALRGALRWLDDAAPRGAGRVTDEILGTVHADAATVLRALHAHDEAARHAQLAQEAWQRLLSGQRVVRDLLTALHR